MPTLKWADVWLLQALQLCGDSGESLDLPRIVAAADGINHAIMTFEEFNNGLYRLREAGLIRLKGPGYALTTEALGLFRQFAGQSCARQLASLCRRLGAGEWSAAYNPNVLESPEVFVSKGTFNDAVLAYQKRYGL